MNWRNIWIKIFGTTQLLGIDIGFWISMLACVIVVIGMNIVFWGMQPMQAIPQNTETDTD